MVMASTAVRNEAESASANTSPLLSIVVPVYNGSKKIESTLQKLKSQIENLLPIVAKLEAQSAGQEKSFVNTGRKIIENASAAMLLDEYLSNHPTDVQSVLGLQDAKADFHETSSTSSWYEIIVVNDGSKDDTRHIVDEISSADETIRLISYSTNMGKGYAIKQAYFTLEEIMSCSWTEMGKLAPKHCQNIWNV